MFKSGIVRGESFIGLELVEVTLKTGTGVYANKEN